MNTDLPQWVKDIPDRKERRVAELRFYVNLAAAHATYESTIRELAKLLGCSTEVIHKSIRLGDMSQGLAARIERLVGRDVVQCEKLSSKFETL